MRALTAQQRRALVALTGGPATATRLGELLGTHANGAAITASSLVRRGMVARGRERHRGRVYVAYRLTPTGLELVKFDQTSLQEATP